MNEYVPRLCRINDLDKCVDPIYDSEEVRSSNKKPPTIAKIIEELDSSFDLIDGDFLELKCEILFEYGDDDEEVKMDIN